MTVKYIILLFALFAFAATVKLELRHPPVQHGYHHFNPLPINLASEESPSTILEEPSPAQEEIIEDKQNETAQEEDKVNDENFLDIPIAGFRSFLARKDIPVTCDALSLPRYSCYNCYSYLVCKPEGGKIKACKDPYAPYCNNGVCSQIPSDSCANL